MSPSSYPLNQDHLAMLNNIIQNHPLIRGVLEKCRDCGVPCDDRIATVDEQLKMATAFKSKFFPDEP